MRYTETRIPPLNLAEGTGLLKRTKASFRLLLGARPINVDIPRFLAGTAQSYHLYVQSEESLYLGRQRDLGEPIGTRLEDHFKAGGNGDELIPPHYHFFALATASPMRIFMHATSHLVRKVRRSR